MPHFSWENPFNQQDAAPPPSLLWVPNPAVAAVSLQDIRERQEALLPLIRDLYRSATEIVEHIRQQTGGDFLLRTRERQVNVMVTYRLPDHPLVIENFQVPITADPVPFPASAKPALPVFDSLLPALPPEESKKTQNLTRILHEKGRLGVLQNFNEKAVDFTDPVVVYPQVLKFVGHWIAKIASPISELEFYEIAAEANIRTDYSSHYVDRPTTAKGLN